jgi:hypothetical protein
MFGIGGRELFVFGSKSLAVATLDMSSHTLWKIPMEHRIR